MDESWANIDIVFRNGLKDFEVLPPREAWDNINPVIKRKQRQFILIRVAAAIAILTAMSFLAYRWTREITTELDNTVVSLNEGAGITGNRFDLVRPAIAAGEKNAVIRSSQKTLIERTTVLSVLSGNEKNTGQAGAFPPETNSLTMDEAKPLVGTPLTSLNSLRRKSFINKNPEQQYLPGNSAVRVTDRWSVSAMASPTYYSRFNSGTNEISKQLMASEQPLISYSGGVAFNYKINKRFSIQSGLYYSSLGKQVNGISSFGGFRQYDYTKGDHNFEVLTTNGTIYTSNADVFLSADGPEGRILTNITNDVFDPLKASLEYINNSLRQNFSYIELPVFLRYKVVDKVIGFNVIGGISYNLLVNNAVYTIIDGGKYPIGKTEGLNLTTISSSFGMGMEYNFSDNLSLNLEPTFRYYLNPFNGMAGLKIHPYSFGIFSGVSYRF